jgi:hypothetical protein
MEKFILARHYAHQWHERERFVRVPVCFVDLVQPLNWMLRKLTRRKRQTTHRMACCVRECCIGELIAGLGGKRVVRHRRAEEKAR